MHAVLYHPLTFPEASIERRPNASKIRTNTFAYTSLRILRILIEMVFLFRMDTILNFELGYALSKRLQRLRSVLRI